MPLAKQDRKDNDNNGEAAEVVSGRNRCSSNVRMKALLSTDNRGFAGVEVLSIIGLGHFSGKIPS